MKKNCNKRFDTKLKEKKRKGFVYFLSVSIMYNSKGYLYPRKCLKYGVHKD